MVAVRAVIEACANRGAIASLTRINPQYALADMHKPRTARVNLLVISADSETDTRADPLCPFGPCG